MQIKSYSEHKQKNKNAYRPLQWPPLDVSTRGADSPGGRPLPVDRETRLKTLPSLAVGKYKQANYLGESGPDPPEFSP